MIAPFPILDLAFSAQARDPIPLPDYAGSLLRGVYGHALRRLTCMTGLPDCAACPLQATCPFPLLFAPPGQDLTSVGINRAVNISTPPYLIIPPHGPAHIIPPDAALRFQMRLFGHAIPKLPFVIEAWRQALRHGLGRSRARATLTGVFYRTPDTLDWHSLTDPLTGDCVTPPIQGPTLTETAGTVNVTLNLLTPLRLQAAGKPLLPTEITPRRLIADIVRRARSLAAHCGTEAEKNRLAIWPVDSWLQAADTIKYEHSLTWQDRRRYSNRQKRSMTLGGLIGKIQLIGVSPSLVPLLHLGSFLHVGKECVFGYGQWDVHDAS